MEPNLNLENTIKILVDLIEKRLSIRDDHIMDGNSWKSKAKKEIENIKKEWYGK